MEQTEGPIAILEGERDKKFPQYAFMLLNFSLFSHFLERDGYGLGSLLWAPLPVKG